MSLWKYAWRTWWSTSGFWEPVWECLKALTAFLRFPEAKSDGFLQARGKGWRKNVKIAAEFEPAQPKAKRGVTLKWCRPKANIHKQHSHTWTSNCRIIMTNHWTCIRMFYPASSKNVCHMCTKQNRTSGSSGMVHANACPHYINQLSRMFYHVCISPWDC